MFAIQVNSSFVFIDESQASNHSDGLFRFNNPNYLREKFHGLNLDDYTFKAKSGVKTGERKYKVLVVVNPSKKYTREII